MIMLIGEVNSRHAISPSPDPALFIIVPPAEVK